MKTTSILKLIEYKVTGGTAVFNNAKDTKLIEKYKLKNETRVIDYQDDSKSFAHRKYDGNITINGENVLRITLRFPKGDGYFRWTDKKYKGLFKELAIKNNYEDNNAYDSVNYTDIFLIKEMLEKIQEVIKTGNCSYLVSYPLKIDEDFLKAATLTAEKEGISVEQWLSKCIMDSKIQFQKRE